MLLFLRLCYLALAASVLFLALTPLPVGQIIESGQERHLLAFAILPVVSMAAWPEISALRQWMLYAIGGAAIEAAQSFMGVGRTAELSDWLVDCAAAAVALLAAASLRGLHRWRPTSG